MKRWVITGPAGAGKSALAACLQRAGAEIVSGDELGHAVLADPAIRDQVVAAFGSRVLRGGQVDREVLGSLVFQDPEAMTRLNGITHPALVDLARQRLAEVARRGTAPLAVLEAAVYFLWPTPPAADLVVAVVASEAIRRKRLKAKGLAAQTVAACLRIQRSWSEYWHRADVVVANEGSLADLQAAADRLLQTYLQRDGGRPPHHERCDP